MAKAKVTCTCTTCGSEFTKTKYCYNRREADNWESWAESYFDTCPDCWRKQQEAKKIEGAAEVIEMPYKDYKAQYSDCQTVADSYDAKSKTVKVLISKERRCKDEMREAYVRYVTSEESYRNWFNDLWNTDWSDYNAKSDVEKEILDILKKWKGEQQ